MAQQNYFGGQNGFTPVGNSTRYGNTPGSAALWSFNDNGSTKYFLPSQYAAGNEWSAAAPNADYIKSLGGKQYTTPIYQEVMNRGNPYAIDYNQTKSFGGNQGWVFDSMPDLASIEQNSQFLPGQGTNNSIWSAGMPGDVALKIGGAMYGGSQLAKMAATAGAGAGGSSLLGTAGATVPEGAIPSLTGVAPGVGQAAGAAAGSTSTLAGGGAGLASGGFSLGNYVPTGDTTTVAQTPNGWSIDVAPQDSLANINSTWLDTPVDQSFTSGMDLGNSVPSDLFAGGGTGAVNPADLGYATSGNSLMDFLGNVGNNIKDWWGGLNVPQRTGLGLGLADIYMRNKQSKQLADIANRASQQADALQQPQRLPYQGLLSNYYNGSQDITQQPMIKAYLDDIQKRTEASMAKFGTSGSGNVPQVTTDYMVNALNSQALPYLNQLSGMAGFGFGPGNSGALYGQYAAQGSGVPFIGYGSFGNALGNTVNPVPWYNQAYNAQQQMMGKGPGADWTLY